MTYLAMIHGERRGKAKAVWAQVVVEGDVQSASIVASAMPAGRWFGVTVLDGPFYGFTRMILPPVTTEKGGGLVVGLDWGTKIDGRRPA